MARFWRKVSNSGHSLSRVGDQIVELLRELISLLVQDCLHRIVTFLLLRDARQISIQVVCELRLRAKNEHAAEGPELLL